MLGIFIGLAGVSCMERSGCLDGEESRQGPLLLTGLVVVGPPLLGGEEEGGGQGARLCVPGEG